MRTSRNTLWAVLRSYLPSLVFVGLGVLVGTAFALLNSIIGRKRSDARLKADPYECGLPSEVSRTFRFGVSFYMVAMLFILFDIEVVFLYPVGVILNAADSVFVLVEILIFVALLLVALIYVWRRGRSIGSNAREAPRPLAARRAGRPRAPGPPAARPRHAARRPRATRTWRSTSSSRSDDPAREAAQLGARELDLPDDLRARLLRDGDDADRRSPRNDLARFGAEAMRASPRQADLIILSGRVSIKMAPVVRRLYDQMLEPKWAISMGACSSSGGMFANYAVVQGADKFMPIDVHVPGCPPRPEALMYGFNKLQQMIQGHPDQGWRRRYNAEGTEEWARDDVIAGQPSEAAEAAYARARQAVTSRRDHRARGPDGPSSAGRGAAMPDAPGLELIAARAPRRSRRTRARHLPRTRPGVPDRRPRADPPRPRVAARHPRPGVQVPRQRPWRRLPARRAALRRPLRAVQPRPRRAHPGARAPARRRPGGG